MRAIWLYGAGFPADWCTYPDFTRMCGSGSSQCSHVLQEDWPEDPAVVERIRADFDEGVGDRRQELVFIGQVGAPHDAVCHVA
jgi:hypothetical protein